MPHLQVVSAQADINADMDCRDSCSVAVSNPISTELHHSGLFLHPDFGSLGSTIAQMPDDRKTHPLDIVPKDESDCCTLSMRRLLAVLISTGMVSTAANPKSVTASDVVQTVCSACFGPQDAKVRIILIQLNLPELALRCHAKMSWSWP
jgi:hypothetical protein